MILIGELFLWMALVMAAWAATTAFSGAALGRRDLAASARRALYVACAALAVAVVAVVDGLVRRDFSLAYVALHTSLGLRTPYAIAVVWSAPAGFMLVWAFGLAAATAGGAFVGTRREPARDPRQDGVSAVLLVFGLLVVCLQTNPFARLAWRAADGRGMDPRLQTPAMVLHGPLLALGYVAAVMPSIVVLGALAGDGIGSRTWAVVRRWALTGWSALTVAVLLDAWNAQALGGAWAWPPEIRSPAAEWIVLAVLLHLLAMRRGGRRLAQARVVVAVFAALAVLGGAYGMVTAPGPETQLVARHAPLGAAWIGGGAVLIAAAAYLAATRGRSLAGSEVASTVAGGRTDPAARMAAIVAHAAALVLVVGLGGSLFASRHEVTLRTGQAATLADPFGRVWDFVGQGVSRYGAPDHDVTAASLEASRDGADGALLVAQRLQYMDAQGDSAFAPVQRAAVHGSPFLDVRVVLEGAGNDRAGLRITFVPFAEWIWIGGALLAMGGLVALWASASGPAAEGPGIP